MLVREKEVLLSWLFAKTRGREENKPRFQPDLAEKDPWNWKQKRKPKKGLCKAIISIKYRDTTHTHTHACVYTPQTGTSWEPEHRLELAKAMGCCNHGNACSLPSSSLPCRDQRVAAIIPPSCRPPRSLSVGCCLSLHYRRHVTSVLMLPGEGPDQRARSASRDTFSAGRLQKNHKPHNRITTTMRLPVPCFDAIFLLTVI